jgi:hypothetical protein
MTGCDPQAVPIIERPRRRGVEYGSLLLESANQPIRKIGDLLAGKDPRYVIDSGTLCKQGLLLPLRQAARNDQAPNLALPLEIEHFVDRAIRLAASSFNKPAGIDDHKIRIFRIRYEAVAVELELSEHPFAIDEIFRTPEAHESVASLTSSTLQIGGERVGQR